jgi:hypothetical protein
VRGEHRVIIGDERIQRNAIAKSVDGEVNRRPHFVCVHKIAWLFLKEKETKMCHLQAALIFLFFCGCWHNEGWKDRSSLEQKKLCNLLER